MRVLVLLMFFCCIVARAADAPLKELAQHLACPQCGTWDLVTAGLGLAGEKIVITPHEVEIPVLGQFCSHVLNSAVDHEGERVRTYRVTLRLDMGEACADPGPVDLRMEIVLAANWQIEANVIEIAVYHAASTVAAFTATGWNRMRQDPCDVGGGEPGVDCVSIEYAQSYKRLAYLLYVLQAGRPHREAAQLARRFNLASFANAVKVFCTRRELESEMGDSRFWGMVCQDERLVAKLQAWQAWSTCSPLPNQPCSMPTERFDRSARIQ